MSDLLTDSDLAHRHDEARGWRCWFRCWSKECDMEHAETGQDIANGEPFPAGPLHATEDEAIRWGYDRERQVEESGRKQDLDLAAEFLVALPDGERPHADP